MRNKWPKLVCVSACHNQRGIWMSFVCNKRWIDEFIRNVIFMPENHSLWHGTNHKTRRNFKVNLTQSVFESRILHRSIGSPKLIDEIEWIIANRMKLNSFLFPECIETVLMRFNSIFRQLWIEIWCFENLCFRFCCWSRRKSFIPQKRRHLWKKWIHFIRNLWDFSRLKVEFLQESFVEYEIWPLSLKIVQYWLIQEFILGQQFRELLNDLIKWLLFCLMFWVQEKGILNWIAQREMGDKQQKWRKVFSEVCVVWFVFVLCILMTSIGLKKSFAGKMDCFGFVWFWWLFWVFELFRHFFSFKRIFVRFLVLYFSLFCQY